MWKRTYKKVFRFSVSREGFRCFVDWATQICSKHGKREVMSGCELIGNYWFAFEQYIRDHGMKLVFVNPASVKKAKELDDNSTKAIAKLLVD